MVDKLHPLQPCQPPPVNVAATVHPLEDDRVVELVNTGLLGAHQVKVAIDALRESGKDLTVIAAEFPPPESKPETKSEPGVFPPAKPEPEEEQLRGR